MAIWHVGPLRFAPAFRALGVREHINISDYDIKISIRVVSIPFKNLVCRPGFSNSNSNFQTQTQTFKLLGFKLNFKPTLLYRQTQTQTQAHEKSSNSLSCLTFS